MTKSFKPKGAAKPAPKPEEVLDDELQTEEEPEGKTGTGDQGDRGGNPAAGKPERKGVVTELWDDIFG